MNPSIEILVHISGSSRGPDDTRYRKETRELLNFEPVTRHEILSLQEDLNGREEYAPQKSNKWKVGVTSSGVEVDSADGLSLGNVEDTVLGTSDVQSVELTQGTTASASQKSIRHEDPVAAQVLKRPYSHVLIERTPAVPRRHTSPAPTTPAAARPHRRTVSDSWKTPPSVIPDSQPSPSFRREPQISSSPCLQRPRVLSSSPSPTRDEESRGHKRQRVEERTSRGREVSTEPRENGRSDDSILKKMQLESLRPTMTLEIHPPRPHSSHNPYDSHLTPSLCTISEKLPMRKYFKPILQARSTEKLERGHWLVSIHSWEASLKAKFWKFLTQFIEEKRAGWGVWCSREFLGHSKHLGDGNDNASDNACAEIIRLYCWGEVIGEIWVLLFIASERKIQGVGARWIDAMQKTVVQME